MNYKFKTKPFQHQKKALADSWSAQYYALFMEMGTGKSKVAIDTIAMLWQDNKINAALIIAPKGVYDNWVQAEIPKHLPDNIETIIMKWMPSSAKKYQNELSDFVFNKVNKLKVFVMNVEALSTARGSHVAKVFLDKNPKNIAVVDESTTIKNRKAARTKTIVKLADRSEYRRILTGSPVTKSPMDLYSQCEFLSPRALKFSSYYAFQGRYANIQQRTMGHRSFQQIVGYRRLDELNEKLNSFSNRVLKDDCLDLPDKIYMKRTVPLTAEQWAVYAQMKALALARLESGDLATTASVLTQIMRLQQICCGFLKTDEGEIQAVPCNRFRELLDIVEETQGKIIIWASFTHNILQIVTELVKVYGADSVATYYGGTPQEERQQIVENFQNKEHPLRFFVGQPKTGGYGITLHEASTVIYFSNSYDLEIRLQSEDRAHRIGQTKSVTYIDLVSPKTIDEKILKALRDKVDIASQVLGEKTKTWLA